jgi:hypothetical protein
MLGGELGGSGAWSRWRRKTERKGIEVGGRQLLKALRGAGRQGKKEERVGGRLGDAWGQEKEVEGGPTPRG